MQQIEELRRQNMELQRQNRELALRLTPADQRATVAAAQQLEDERAQLQAERANLNQAALKLRARELAAETGMDVAKLEEHTSIEAMQAAAFDFVRTNLNDPAAMRRWADFLERTGGNAGAGEPNSQGAAGAGAVGAGVQMGADGRPLAPAATGPAMPGQSPAPPAPGAPVNGAPGAPGTQVPPAGAGGPSGGTQSLGPDPIDEITTRHAGKGSSDLATWLQELHALPAQTVTMGGPPPTIATPAPAPPAAPQQAAAAVS